MLPETSIRGRIQRFLFENSDRLQEPILEIGSRIPDKFATWADNRWLARKSKWVGVDLQAGTNVDVVANAENLPFEDASFGAAIASEVLEHLRRPALVLAEIHRVLRPGAAFLVTVPFTFPVHCHPDDFWRFTPSGLRALLEDAGFKEVETIAAGAFTLHINDHGEPGVTAMKSPSHVFARATA